MVSCPGLDLLVLIPGRANFDSQEGQLIRTELVGMPQLYIHISMEGEEEGGDWINQNAVIYKQDISFIAVY
jgi:hypothetical protein